MRIKGVIGGYTKTAKLFHWITALIVMGMIPLGFYMVMIEPSPFKFELYGWHKSFGMTVLALTFLRLGWRFLAPAPGALLSHRRWEVVASKTAHGMLYFLLIAMPLSGWVMSAAADYPVPYFWLFEVPDPVGKSETLFEYALLAHEIMGYALFAILFVHIGAALKHHIFDWDATLKRMAFFPVNLRAISLLTALTALFFAGTALLIGASWLQPEKSTGQASQPAREIQSTASTGNKGLTDPGAPDAVNVAQWQIIHDQSSIAFETEVYDSPVRGEFGDFDGTILFAPDRLKQSRVRIEINLRSADTGSQERDSRLQNDKWFDVENHPLAVFEARDFVPDPEAGNIDHAYIARGTLTIKGVERYLTLPFTLEFDKDADEQRVAIMTAQTTLKRLAYNVGEGQWEKGETVDNQVRVIIDLKAKLTASQGIGN